MTQDHNKKTLRQFQCRDYLWEIFEQMGAELECSTDYLVNEAMRQYARSRNWGSRGRTSQPGAAPALAGISNAGVTGEIPRGGPPHLRPTPMAGTPAAGAQIGAHPSQGFAARGGAGPASLPPPLPAGGGAP